MTRNIQPDGIIRVPTKKIKKKNNLASVSYYQYSLDNMMQNRWWKNCPSIFQHSESLVAAILILMPHCSPN